MNIEFAKAGDCAELLDFLHGVFLRDNPKHVRFEALFPDIFVDDDAHMRDHAVVREGGRIVACVGAYPMKLRVAGCDVPIAGIGQVSTGKEWLGRGCMSALMKTQLERLRSLGTALVWLGGRHDRYAHFGFETAGYVWNFGVDARSLVGVKRTAEVVRHEAGAAAAAVTDALFARFLERGRAVVVEDAARFRARLARGIGGACEIWTAGRDAEGLPEAFAVVCPAWRKIDAHFGSPEALAEIASAAVAAHGGYMQIEAPATDSAFCDFFRANCSWMGLKLASFAVLDRDRLLDAYAPAIRPGTRLPSREMDGPSLARFCFGPEAGPFPPLPFHLPDVYHV